jgi:hypothetical protein
MKMAKDTISCEVRQVFNYECVRGQYFVLDSCRSKAFFP